MSCDNPAGGGGEPTDIPTELIGKWINQSETSIVVLEFTANQLKISGTPVSTYSASETDGEIKIGASSSSINEVFCESYDITAGVLTFTGGKSDEDYPSANFYKINALSSNQWKDGGITSDSQGQVWYSFNVTGGTTYSMWWNDDDSGNGLKTLDVQVSAYYSSGTSAFTNANTAWGTARSFTPTSNDTVYVKITPNSSSGSPTGTFGIVYSTGTERPNAPFNPPSPMSLIANEWKDGEITSDSNGAVWYSFNVTSSVTTPTTYNLWWNESGSNGNGVKTLDVKVTGFYKDGSPVPGFSAVDTAWTSPHSFTPLPNQAGTVYFKVTPSTSGKTGTFGIVYNTGAPIDAERPPAIFNPPNSTPLTTDVWTDGEITTAGDIVWYSLTVVSGQDYYFWWNEGGTSNTSNGNRTKTLNIQVSAFDNEGTIISGFTDVGSAWSTSKSYAPTADGPIYLRVTSYSSNNTGTYGIVYSETNSRPPVPIDAVNPIALTAGEWKRGEISSGSSGELWYSFEVTASTAYRIWWNDSADGNGLFRTLDVRASAWGSTGDSLFYDTDTAWTSAQSYTPTVNGTVYIKVYPKTEDATGTFDIVYINSSGSRPPVPFIAPEPPNPIPLVDGVWMDGAITTEVGEVWYSINVTASTTYRIWTNGFAYGNGLKTLSIGTSTWYSNGTSINPSYSPWNSAQEFIPTADGTVYIRVRASGSGSNTGTFGIVYSTSNTRPAVIFTPPVNPTPLTANEWKDGEINAASNGEAWYSFTVTGSTTYRIWLNDYFSGSSSAIPGNDTKTLDISLRAYYSDGIEVFNSSNGIDSAWEYGEQFTPTTAQTVYVKVYPKNSGNTGTFGVVYNTGASTIRPIIPFDPPASPTELTTAGTWTDGEITSSSGSEVWYSLSVTNNTRYQIWWNDGGGSTSSGDKSKTLNVKASALYSSGVEIFSGVDDGWGSTSSSGSSSSSSFTASSTGTVYIKVYPKTAGATGTFGITYNTGTANRPPVPITPVSPIALTADTWTDGEITAADGELWYSFSVTNNTRYYVWWNEAGSSSNGSKTLDVTGSGYYADGGLVEGNFTYADSAWSYSQNFTAEKNDTVYIRIRPKNPDSTGTFGIVYTTTNTRPAITP